MQKPCVKAIILAGGVGARLDASTPKQFLTIDGVHILEKTIKIFLDTKQIDACIVVSHPAYITKVKEIVNTIKSNIPISICEGGATRFLSSKNAIMQYVHPQDIVLIHDAARACVSKKIIDDCIIYTQQYGNAVPCMSCKDSIRMLKDDNTNCIVDRNKVKIIQTPQGFKGKMLLHAFNTQDNKAFTDDASVVEKAGYPIFLFEGSEHNIKITYDIDLIIAQYIAHKQIS